MTQPADRAVKALTKLMRAKLRTAVAFTNRSNDYVPVSKRGWERLPPSECFVRALGEMAELSRALASGNADNIRKEAADVANYLAFLVANVSTAAMEAG